MDLFKLLTRSSKLSPAAKITTPQNLPSAGQSASPQLFGRANGVQELVLGKRKREDHPPELDFFCASKGRKAGKPETTEDAEASDNDHGVEENDDVDEWKRTLRMHKVKITVLSQVSRKRKPKKAKKKKDKDETKKLTLAYTRPLLTFSQLQSRYGLRRQLIRNIHAQGYTIPTEIQLAALPMLLGESLHSKSAESTAQAQPARSPIHLLAAAPTGSGKTLAFLIPIFSARLDQKATANEARAGPRALVVAPTRELAGQIVNEGRKLALDTGVRVTLIKKGMKVGSEEGITVDHDNSDDIMENESISEETPDNESALPQHNLVKADIIVATPLALLHALKRGEKKQALLPSVEHLVLDEADVLLDPLFRQQVLSIWKSCISTTLRTSLWSATMASSIETLAVSTIQSRESSVPASIVRLVIGLKDSALPTVSHSLTYAATEAGKLLALRQLLHPTAPTSAGTKSLSSGSVGIKELRPPFLVFTQTIARAVALHSELRYDIPPEAGGPSRIAVLHAGLSESARSSVMARFRMGELWVIITTDLLARGIDFRGLNGVVNYDVPTSAAVYVHRAGRTGRAGRMGGLVVTLYTKEDVPYIRPIANVIATSEKMRGESGGGIQQWLFDALPIPSKRDKKKVKERGIEIRRPGVKGAMISTKAPERRQWNDRKNHGKTTRQAVRSRPFEEIDFMGFGD